MEAMLSKQPETYSELIARSFKLYFASFSKIIGFAVILSIIVFTPRILTNVLQQDMFAMLPPLSPHRLWFVIIDLAALTFFIAIIWHMYCVIRHRHEPMIEDVSVGAKKAFLVFIAAIIQTAIFLSFGAICYGLLLLLHQYNLLFINSMMGLLATGLVFFALLALLSYVSVLFIFLVPLIAIEDKNIFRALETSVLLVWNHWWRVFSTQLTPWFWYLVLLFVIKYAIGINVHIYFTETNNLNFIPTIVHLLVFAMFIPWVAAILVVQLKDLELRNHLVPKRKRGK